MNSGSSRSRQKANRRWKGEGRKGDKLHEGEAALEPEGSGYLLCGKVHLGDEEGMLLAHSDAQAQGTSKGERIK